jgi:hypothetical protein
MLESGEEWWMVGCMGGRFFDNFDKVVADDILQCSIGRNGILRGPSGAFSSNVSPRDSRISKMRLTERATFN